MDGAGDLLETTPQCSVLRCEQPADGRWVRGEGRSRFAFYVCDQHGRALEGGEDRRYHYDERVIVMGDDLSGFHEWVVVGWGLPERRESEQTTLLLQVRRLGTEQEETHTYVIDAELRMGLGQMMAREPVFGPVQGMYERREIDGVDE